MATVDMFCDICRLCGNQQRDNFNIFGNEGKKRNIQDKIKMKIDIDVTRDDPLPKVVCRVCYERLELFTRFQDKCHETQNTLMNIFLSSVEASTSDDGGVNIIHKANVVPKVVYFHGDATSSRPTSDDKLAADIEVKMDPEIADESQPGRARTAPEQISGKEKCSASPVDPVEHLLPCKPTTPASGDSQQMESQKTKETTIEGNIYSKVVTILVPGTTQRRFQKKEDISVSCDDRVLELTGATGPKKMLHLSPEKRKSLLDRELLFQNVKARHKAYILKQKSRQQEAKSFIKEQNSKLQKMDPGSEKTMRKTKGKVKCETVVAQYIQKVALKQFRCLLCNEEFQWISRCEFHVRKHIGEKPFKCSECGRAFFAANNLYSHVKRSHSGINIRYSCDICGKSVKDKPYLKIHMESHLSENKYVCKTCDFSCKTSYTLAQHIRAKHNKNIFVCDVCKKVFTNGNNVARHKKKHITLALGLVKCSICLKKFSSKNELMLHMRYHNDTDAPFTCELCLMYFKTQRCLSCHNVHSHPILVRHDKKANKSLV